ncbi:unnamed protein product, partial [Phaeothamnion confervicola]
MAKGEFRTLGKADGEALTKFLARTPDTAMFLRSNLRHAGIVDKGKPYQGTYVGAFEAGELAGVAVLYWNGNMLFQCAPGHAVPLA